MENTATGSASSFEMARFWMNDCLENHSKCPKPASFLPTRVIDVGPPDGSNEPYLFEEARSSQPLAEEQRRYAALSHCWGPPPHYRTTDETLEDRRKCIPMADLPRTFQEAVTVTRNMGVRYLWIDSLCIIQASESDWKKEAVRMCDYYQNALFTITAAHSNNSRGGLFVKRDGIRILPFEIDIKLPDRTAHCQFSPMSKREITFGAEDLPLYKRAWVLQEMILSSRALIYDPDVVRWECLTGYGSERDPNGGIGRHHVRVRELQNAIAHLGQHEDAMDALGDSIQQRSSGWEHFVDDYMSRGLTNESDGLIAIAGVAEAIEKHTTDTYLAGLWKSLLPHGLTWHVRHYIDPEFIGSNVGNVQKPPPYRRKAAIAPSWSFASVNVNVKYSSSVQETPLCQIVDATVDGPAFSQTGKLTIYGDCRVAYMMRENKSITSETLSLYKNEKMRYEEDYGLKQALVRPDGAVLISFEPPRWLNQAQAIPGIWYPDEIVDPQTPVTFIALLQRPYLSRMPSGARNQVVHTLALVPTGGADGEYRRVGYATWNDCAWYGYDCCEYRESKKEPYKKLARKWGRIKPPQLAVNGTKEHPTERHTVEHDVLPPLSAYHEDAKMKRMTIVIV